MPCRNTLIAACIACGALVGTPASAVVVSSVTGAPGNVVTDFSSAGFAAINLDLRQSSAPTTIHFEIEAGDLGGPLTFNAVIAILFGQGIDRFLLTLDNASFDFIGSVESGFGGSAAMVSGAGTTAGIDFHPPETFGFNIGDPFVDGFSQDWRIDITGLAEGDSFSLTLAVPEPGSLPLILAALAGAGWFGARRRGGRA